MLFILLILPAVVFATINIAVQPGSTRDKVDIQFTGTNREILPDGERELWGITDFELMRAVRDWVGKDGDYLDYLYVKEPTPHKMYTRPGKTPVTRVLYPRKATIVRLNSVPEIVTTKEFINNSTIKGIFSAGITKQVEQEVETTWSFEDEMEVEQKISYKIEFKAFGSGVEVGGSTSFVFTNKWGEEASKSNSTTIGTSTGIQVELKPGEAVMVTLTASHGELEVRMDYTAKLDGQVVSDYQEGEYYPINKILSTAGRRTFINSTEVIKINFFSEARVVMSKLSA